MEKDPSSGRRTVDTPFFVKRSKKRFPIDLGSVALYAVALGGAFVACCPHQAPPIDNSIEGLLEIAGTFRDRASLSLAYAAQNGNCESALQPYLNSQTGQDDLLWPLFFQGSIIIGGRLPSPAPLIAYYNTIYDTAFVTQWRVESSGWTLTKAIIRHGADLEGKERPAAARIARWLGPKQIPPDSLQQQFARFQKDWEKLHPGEEASAYDLTSNLNDERTFGEFEAQMDIGARSMRMICQGELAPVGLIANELCSALRAGNADILDHLIPSGNPQPIANLIRIPVVFLAELRPCYALFAEEKTLVFFLPKDQPNFMAIYELGKSNQASVAPLSFVVFNLLSPQQAAEKGGEI
jgi:hypothetical protein